MSIDTAARVGHCAEGTLHPVMHPSDGSVIDEIRISSEAD